MHNPQFYVSGKRPIASMFANGLVEVSKDRLGSAKPACQNYSCIYGGGLSRDDIDYIYKCFKCEGPHRSYLCAKCRMVDAASLAMRIGNLSHNHC